MEGCKAPPPLQPMGNISENWMLWKQQLENYILATDKNDKDDRIKIAILLTLIGTEGLQLYNTFDFASEDERNSYQTVLEKFESHYSPRKNVVYEHFKFFSRIQQENETTEQFITELKKLAANCEFKEREVMLRDRIVLGTKYKPLQEKMLREPDLELEKAIQYCQAYETSKIQAKDIQKAQNEVDAITYMDSKWRRPQNYVGESQRLSYTAQKQVQDERGFLKKDYRTDCGNCGYTHEPKRCPAKGKKCNNCSKIGHFAAVCRTKYTKYTRAVELDNNEEEPNNIVLWEVHTANHKVNWNETINIEGHPVNVKIDTGSEVNILNTNILSAVKSKTILNKSKNKLFSYSGHPIDYLGVVNLNVKAFGKNLTLEFHIIDKASYPIIGLGATISLGLVNVNTKNVNNIKVESPESILNKYSAVFEGQGKLKAQYKIRLEDNAVPVAVSPRKIPLAIQEQVKMELRSMVEKDIIEPVVGPTDWASPIVIVVKPGKKLRICMDPRALNEYVIREKCWIPTAETVFAQLGNAQFFTVLDASEAFHQIQLDRDSSLLCTITTPFGRFRYKRLPYGLSSAPEVFQKTIGDILEGILGTVNYIDDILIYGTTLEEHNDRLQQVLKKIQAAGLKLSRTKIQLAVNKIHYLGYVISQEGIEIDPKKIEAIANIPRPKTKKELQRFLGVVTHLAKYIPNLSEKSAALRRLLSNKYSGTWERTGPEEKSFNDLKAALTTPPVLKHFNTSEEITLSVDASGYGLGAILMQNEHPIAYASATLTETQRRYSQIEKELLAVVYACEHFNYFVFGRSITVHTDHKPLLAIVKKPLEDITPRLQRLVLRLMRYDIKLKHIPGKNLIVADALSRDPSNNEVTTAYLDEVKTECPIQLTSSRRTRQLMEATKEDTEFKQLIIYSTSNWPPKQKHLPQMLKKYWTSKDDIYFEDGLLYKGTALMIPLKLRPQLLKVIHNSHQGIESCRLRARDTLYWPGMMKDIKDTIMSCSTCQQYARSNTKETLKPHEVPMLPWQKLGIDFKSHGNLNYLVMIDYYSKFIVVNKILDKTANSVIIALKNIFAVNGIPKVLYSDNGPPFDSLAYNEFLDTYDIIKNTSSPRYPQSNGMVERSIQSVKAMIYKACKEKDDLMLAVLNHNSTPKQGTISPAEILMGRKLRTLIPMTDTLLKPRHDTASHYAQLLKNSKKMSEANKTNTLPTLIPGQPIYIQKGIRNWEPAQVLQDLDNNSFNILTEQGNILRRNRYHLKPRFNNKCMENSSEEDQADGQQVTEPINSQDQGIQGELPDQKDNKEGKESQHNKPLITRSGRIVKPRDILDL